MRYFLDTEFLESGPGEPIHLFSIGIISEDGREFYAINKECPLDVANEWVKANVLPHVDLSQGISREEIKAQLIDFIAAGDGSKPQFWGYYCDYDWVVFCQIFGNMTDLPDGYPMFCFDLKQWAMMLGNPQLPQQAETEEHHALNDAKWVRLSFWSLQRLALQYVGAFSNAMGVPLELEPSGPAAEAAVPTDDEIAAREA